MEMGNTILEFNIIILSGSSFLIFAKMVPVNTANRLEMMPKAKDIDKHMTYGKMHQIFTHTR